MDSLQIKLKALFKRRFIRFGIPFLCFVLGGSFVLNQFTKIRFDFKPKKVITQAEADLFGVKMKDPKEVTLESEYEKIKKMDIDNWTNIRGPRPWEE